MKRILLISLMTCLSLVCLAQHTKIRGVVTDADTGEPIPFAGVYFKGTTVGISADEKGKYFIDTDDRTLSVLVCQILGFDTVEKKIKPGTFNNVDFRMKFTNNQLATVIVKADNRKIKRLLANIDAHREKNNPELRPYYRCDVYNKMELDLSHAKERLKGKNFQKEFGFVFDYMDTSAVSGVPYLPVMMSESVVKRYHRRNPALDNEEVLANRVSGVNADANILSQFTGSMHLKCNFYSPFVNCFDVEFPSPIQNGGLLFYNYFIIDSLQVDGRKTYKVRYHPKENISSPALDGEMLIDARDYALRSIHARMKQANQANWIRDLALEAEYTRLPDSSWFYRRDYLYADFSISLRDSSKLMSVLGSRNMVYMNPVFDTPDEILDVKEGIVKVHPEANYRDEEYWRKVRPFELSRKEKDIFAMVDRIKETRGYKIAYDVITTLVNGYWDVGPVGFGPILKTISFNNLEGFRAQIGMHTSKDLSKKFRFSGYLAYGVKDRQFKGGLEYEQLFSKEPTSKLTVSASYDVFQLGRGNGMFTDVNLLSSILGKGDANKLAPLSNYSIKYEHEFSMNINLQTDMALKRYYSNMYVPMRRLDGTVMQSLATNELHALLRFSKEETVARGHFIKTYLHTKYPVIGLDLTGSIPGIRKGDYGFFRPEVILDWKFRIPPVGMSQIHFNAGTIIGQVPWPLLHLHEGNGTYVLDKSAFACMDYFEFASDSWLTLMWNHNFNGFFLGKVPFLKYLDLREEFTFKMAYSMLSDKNNPTLPGASPLLMEFPKGMTTMGKVPYMEIGVGISNIFQLFRVDCFWRLTHRDTARKNFNVTVGMEFRF